MSPCTTSTWRLSNLAPSLVTALVLLPVLAQGQYNYTTNKGTITITQYKGPGGPVTIPSVLNGLPVTTIATGAFENGTNLTAVTLPNSITNIGAYAFNACRGLIAVTLPHSLDKIEDMTFSNCSGLTSIILPDMLAVLGVQAFAGCTSLTSIALPDNLASIGVGAFEGCANLTTITVPKGLTNIGNSALAWCASLTSIDVDPENPSYSSLHGVLLTKDQSHLIKCPERKKGHYLLPDGVTSIAEWAFHGCDSLTCITLPAGLTTIGEHAFYLCASLTSITLPSSLTSIGQEAFSGCVSLTGVFFQGNAPSVGWFPFYRAADVIVYHLPGATGWDSTFGGRYPRLGQTRSSPLVASKPIRTPSLSPSPGPRMPLWW